MITGGNIRYSNAYIKIRNTSSEAARSRHDYEKENFAMEKYQKLLRGEISRKQYVCILSYPISICAKNEFICLTTYLRQYYFCANYLLKPCASFAPIK
jgi:hypothetical protein